MGVTVGGFAGRLVGEIQPGGVAMTDKRIAHESPVPGSLLERSSILDVRVASGTDYLVHHRYYVHQYFYCWSLFASKHYAAKRREGSTSELVI
jgi:hypothetical protein